MSTSLSKRYAHMWTDMYKGIDPQGPFYEVKYKFDNWADSDNIANEMAGFTTRLGGATVRTPPHQHPLSPNLYCAGVRITGVGRPVLNSAGIPFYDNGFTVDATYRTVTLTGQFNPADDPQNLHQVDPTTPILWCTQELDSTTEMITLPNHQFKFMSTGKPTGIPCTLRVGITIMRLTFLKLPYLPTGVLKAARNKTNSSTFLGAAAGSVLFNRHSTSRDFSSDGSVAQRVTLEFHERDKPWNQAPMPDSLNTWDYVTDAGGSNFMFQSTDLNTVIRALM